MVLTTSYLLVCKWDLTMRCFPVHQNSLTPTDCVGHFIVPEESGEVSMDEGNEGLSPSAEHTAVRNLSLPASLCDSGSYTNQCNSCSNKISCVLCRKTLKVELNRTNSGILAAAGEPGKRQEVTSISWRHHGSF